MKKYKYQILLAVFILAYIIYFSYFTILRYKTLYASYYDLGIMHQTVYNTFISIKTGDWSRFLELTNPVGSDQIKRMAIHNDIFLALLAPFYFLHSGPETLLVIQTAIIALGAIAIFKIANIIFQKNKYSILLSLIFSLAYLLYPPLERANIFDFHAVVLSTTFLLFMFYFLLVRKYGFSFLFFVLSLLTKEQVALTTIVFGVYTLIISNIQFPISNQIKNPKFKKTKQNFYFPLLIIGVSIIWFVLSVFYIIPIFRGGQHFAASRYSDFGESPIRIITGILSNPYSISKYIFRVDTWRYLKFLLNPVAFLPLLSPSELFIALPEFAINLLSKNPNMRNIIYHYTAVITPFVLISAIYAAKRIFEVLQIKRHSGEQKEIFVGLLVLFFSLYFAYIKGPLPFSKEKNIHPFKYPQKEAKDTAFWSKTLRNEQLKISTTGQLSPFFTSRRYFYTFSARYRLADYVIVRLNEIYNYPEKNELIPVYERLKKDYNYELIYQKENFEVYKRKVKS